MPIQPLSHLSAGQRPGLYLRPGTNDGGVWDSAPSRARRAKRSPPSTPDRARPTSRSKFGGLWDSAPSRARRVRRAANPTLDVTQSPAAGRAKVGGLWDSAPSRARRVRRAANPTLDVTQSPAAGRAKVGGEGGIRTHGAREGSTVFETARFNRSRTSPKAERGFYVTRRGQPKAAGWADGQEPSSRVGAPRRVAVTGAKKLAKSLVFR